MSPCLPFSGIFTPSFVNSSFACSRVNFPDFSCSKIDFAFSFVASSKLANISLRFSFSGSFTPSSSNCFFVSSIIVFTFCFVASSKSFFAVFVDCSAAGVFVAANAGMPTPPMIPNDKAPAIAKYPTVFFFIGNFLLHISKACTLSYTMPIVMSVS